MSEKSNKRRMIAAIAGLGLVATGLPAVASASGDATVAEEKNKVSAVVTSQLEDADSTDVWVQLNAKADLSAADGMSWDERGQYVYDRLRETADESQADLLADLDARGVEYSAHWAANAVFVKGADEELVAEVAALSEVEAITPEITVSLIEPVEASPAPAPLQTTWGLDFIKAPQIWADYDQRGEGIVVGTLDSGFQADHPALVEKYRGTADGTDDYNWLDTTGTSDVPVDTDGHGTHVTGTMVGGEGENEIGVAPDAQFIGGTGCCVAGANPLDAIEWFLAPTPVGGGEGDPAKRAHIVNNSWGYSYQDGSPAQIPSDDPELGPVFDGIQAWNDSGIFGVFASGNSGPGCDTVGSPAWNVSAAYSVGNHQEDGSINPSSSRGPGEDGEPGVDIAAPGTNVLSSLPGDNYGEYTGTSMASPHVAGAVALLWAEFPDLQGDVEGTIALLDEAALDAEDPTCGGEPADNDTFGEGSLDLVALFEAAGGDDPEPPTAEVARLAGGDRWETAEVISAAFPEGVSTVYIANAEAAFDGVDSLAAGAAAAKGAVQLDETRATPDGEPAPILMVKSGEVPGATHAALDALAPANVVILGGDTVVSDAVQAEIADATGADVTRIEGENRYETAANVALEFPANPEVVYVATGQGDTTGAEGLALADALTASSLAGSQGAPVLLTRTEALPSATAAALEELAPENIVIVGGEAAVEPQVEIALSEFATTTRLAGADRYETASLMLEGYPVDGDVLFVASGQNFPDALAGSSLSGSLGAPLVVVNHKVPEDIATVITGLSPQGITIFGGEAAVNADAEAELQAILDVTSVD